MSFVIVIAGRINRYVVINTITAAIAVTPLFHGFFRYTLSIISRIALSFFRPTISIPLSSSQLRLDSGVKKPVSTKNSPAVATPFRYIPIRTYRTADSYDMPVSLRIVAALNVKQSGGIINTRIIYLLYCSYIMNQIYK